MKKTLIPFLIAIAISVQTFSQTHTISLGAGPSFVGKIIGAIALDLGDSITKVNSTVLPVFNVSYDYRVSEQFSIGGSFTYQRMGINFKDFYYVNDNNEEKYADASINYNRINFAIRPLFHYVESDRFDVYSGLRIGLLSSSIGITTNASDLADDEFKFKMGTRPSFQIILCGLRAYVTDNIGIHTEVAIGSPYYFNFGLQYRL